jgi:ABC-2 type transport system permease protein
VPVAIWELNRMLRRKDFLVSVLLTPVIALGAGLVMNWVKKRQDRQEYRIAVVRPLGTPVDTTARPLPPLEKFTWVPMSGADATPEAVKAAIQRRDVEGAVVLRADFADSGKVKLLVRREAPGWKKRVTPALQAEARRMRAATRGLGTDDLARIDAPIELEEELALPRAPTTRGDRLAALLSMVLVMMSIFISGSYLNIGITGEKQSRMTEVIVSAIRPQSWIDGKIVAYTLIGLVQVALWAASGMVIAMFFAYGLPPRMNVGLLAMFGLFTLLGLTFYTALYAVIAATIKDLQSTQKFQAYLFFLPMIPLFFVDAAVETPDAPWVSAVSLLPPFAPMLMPMRVAMAGAAPWEPAVALIGLVLASWFMRLAAGHAFRIGMLMYGKELTLPELARWAKAK